MSEQKPRSARWDCRIPTNSARPAELASCRSFEQIQFARVENNGNRTDDRAHRRKRQQRNDDQGKQREADRQRDVRCRGRPSSWYRCDLERTEHGWKHPRVPLAGLSRDEDRNRLANTSAG